MNVCQLGTTEAACGGAGAACDTCSSGRECSARTCALPSSCQVTASPIEFGLVARGSTQVRTFTVTNSGDVARAIGVVFTSNSSNRISVEPSGTISLAPNATQVFTVTLDTTRIGSAIATLPLQRDSSCSSDVSIRGEVVETLLSTAPASLDFGYVTPSFTKTTELTVSNAGSAPITLRNFKTVDQGQTTPSSIFTYAGAGLVVVPAEGNVTLAVAFKPAVLGPRQGLLTFDTDAFGQPTASIPLRGAGGGPKVDVAPTLTLPPSAVGLSQRGVVVVKNVGVRPNPADPAGNLHLTFVVRPLANTAIDEVLVEFPPTYDRTAGVEAGQFVNLDVTFIPQTAGTKSLELNILSDDLSAPVVTVIVTMEAVAPAPCTYTVTPSTIDFGAARAWASLEWPVTVTNTGTTSCTVLEARIVTGSSFSVQGFTARALAPGESSRFKVRYVQVVPPLAGSPRTLAGTLRVNTNSSTTPSTDVALSALSEASCILKPTHVDFGSAPISCRSAALGIPLANVCNAAVTVSNATIVTASGGTSAEFVITSGSGLSLAAKTDGAFAAAYVPSNLGIDDDAFLTFTSTEPAGTVRHLIPLRGTGISGNVTETFTISPPTLDVLFAIDDSPSMVDEQTALANSVASFGMLGSTIDVRFAATSADLASPDLGVLRRTSSNATFVSRSTVNAGAELGSLLRIGGTGSASSCLEASTRALSDDRRFGQNSGFLRENSRLGVICVTDSPDETANTMSFELNRLALVRPELTYSVVGPFLPTPPSGCTYDGANTVTHDTAVTRFSGVKEEVCNVMTSTGNAITHLVTQSSKVFTLSRAVDLSGTTTVTLDGTAVPSTGWSIDPVTHRLTFSASNQPATGQTAAVTYQALCY